MVSVQDYGPLRITATWLMRYPEGLPTIDNEIWFEEIHLDFSSEEHFPKDRDAPDIGSSRLLPHQLEFSRWILVYFHEELNAHKR
jgi:hypothetical protein